MTEGNHRVAEAGRRQINQYIENNERVLKSLAVELRTRRAGSTGSAHRILKDYVLDFPEFREISLFDDSGRPLGNQPLRPTRRCRPEAAKRRRATVYVAPLNLDNDALPTTTIAVPVAQRQSWTGLDRRRARARRAVADGRPHHGRRARTRRAVSENGRLVAHGNPDKKRLIALASGNGPLAQKVAARLHDTSVRVTQYHGRTRRGDARGRGPVPGLNWMVGGRAADGRSLRRRTAARSGQLLLVIGAALLGTIVVGYAVGPHRSSPASSRSSARPWPSAKGASTSGSRSPAATS